MRLFLFFPIFSLGLSLLTACGEPLREEVLSQHPNGMKKKTILVNGKGETAERETWYFDGIKESEVPYRNGKADGAFTRWTSHGDIAETGNYISGLREGEWTEWFANGKPEARGIYRNGKKQGTWIKRHYDGELAAEKKYENGDPVGTWKEYYKSGAVKSIDNCFAHTGAGSRESFLENGKRVRTEHCKNGILDGIVENHYPSGALETRSLFKNGKIDGKEELFRATGSLWRTAHFKEGVRDSVWIYYDAAGNVFRQSKFQNGNGIAYSLPGDDALNSETTFVNNKIEDSLRYQLPGHRLEYTEIWENGEKVKLISRYAKENGGRLASEGNFSGGKRNGSWRNWYPNGTIKDSLFYKDDEAYGEQIHFDSTGKVYLRKTVYGFNGQSIVKFE